VDPQLQPDAEAAQIPNAIREETTSGIAAINIERRSRRIVSPPNPESHRPGRQGQDLVIRHQAQRKVPVQEVLHLEESQPARPQAGLADQAPPPGGPLSGMKTIDFLKNDIRGGQTQAQPEADRPWAGGAVGDGKVTRREEIRTALEFALMRLSTLTPGR